MDAITDISRFRIAKLYASIQPLAFRVLQDITRATGRVCNIAQGLRTFEEQSALYAIGRQLTPQGWKIVNLKKIVTNSRPGLSWHCYGLAFDISFVGKDPYLLNETSQVREGLWETYGKIGRSFGFKWGGDFHLLNGVKDLPHLELSYGLSIDQALEMYTLGGIQTVWAHIDQLIK